LIHYYNIRNHRKMIEKNGAAILPGSFVRLRQADWAVCFPLVQGEDVASRTKTDAFILRQVADSADRSRFLVHPPTFPAADLFLLRKYPSKAPMMQPS
jgi:hypothetical protein